MMQIEENGHQMGFSKKFMMENAGAATAKRLVEKFVDVKSKKVLVFFQNYFCFLDFLPCQSEITFMSCYDGMTA